MTETLKCFDCYLAEGSDLYACPTHATPEERKAMDERVKNLAFLPNPFLPSSDSGTQHVRYTKPIVNATFDIPKDDE